MAKLVLIKKWPHPGDPAPNWLINKAQIAAFTKINAQFEKKFLELQNEKIRAINAIK